jgi:YVTN family beta-propeller protein
VEFRILGPLEVEADDRLVPLGGAKQRGLLSILLLHSNKVVSRAALTEGLWGERPPGTAVTALQVHVSQLRKTLREIGAPGTDEIILTRAPGYMARVEPDRLDLLRFERLIREGRTALARRDPASASMKIGDALALWRGAPLVDLDSAYGRIERARLEELRLSALDDRIEADLALGRHADIVSELEALVATHPLRERLRVHLMLTLYRCGRQVAALETFHAFRRQLLDELGLEPGEPLQHLERAILNHDPSLMLTARSARQIDVESIPTGTVTFLFTDIEGSTQLLQQMRNEYPEILAAHRRILRGAFAEHGGHEVDALGDAVFFVFRRAHDAVLAAADAQRALAAYEWPGGVRVRVRMGLHTGEPELAEGGYLGLGVHRGARIAAAGHGDQVLLSQATRAVLEDDELPDIELRDLGEHDLRDFDRPVRLHQLTIAGLPSEFPPIGTARPLEGRKRAPAAILRRRVLPAGAIAAVVAAAVFVPVFAFAGGRGSGPRPPTLGGDSVGVIDPLTGSSVAQVAGVPSPGAMTAGAGSIWTVSPSSNSVARIDTFSRSLRQTIPVGSDPSGIAFGAGAAWVVNREDGTVSRIDPRTNGVVQRIRVGSGPAAIAFGSGSLWVANADDRSLTQIAPRTGRRLRTIDVGASATGLTVADGAVWMSDTPGSTVIRVDARSGQVTGAPDVGSGPTAVASGFGSIWVANGLDGTVTRIDPRTARPVATISVGAAPGSLTAGPAGIWVANQDDDSVVEIDPRTNTVARTFAVGNRPGGLMLGGGSLWLALDPSGGAHRGGTLTADTTSLDSIDPAVAYSLEGWDVLAATGDGLVAYQKVGGGDGTRLVPDLAIGLPTIGDGGRTFTFTLRRGIRYSNGALVRPEDFQRAIERMFELRSASVRQDFAHVIGARACSPAYTACDLSRGVVVDDHAGTITFRLDRPDPQFLYSLALPAADAVPSATPGHDIGVHPVPATGPYRIASYRPRHELLLVRNRRFHAWSEEAQPSGYPDRILFRVVSDEGAALDDVEHGRADIALDGVPPTRLQEVETQYASQVHVTPQPATLYLALNTRIPPFDDAKARRALNYALDKRRITQLLGGADVAAPTCQVLPPNFPGYRPYCPFTTRPGPGGSWIAPDWTRARRLVAASGTRGEQVTLWYGLHFPPLASYTASVLRELGYRVRLRRVANDTGYFAAIGETRNHVQAAFNAWYADFPAASQFFTTQLTCESFKANSAFNNDISEYCNPLIDAKVRRALALQAISPTAANHAWANIDRSVVNDAPWVPLVTPKAVDFVARRVGNFERHPLFGPLLAEMWIR